MHGEGPLLVIAGPGSGKTRVITLRIASLIERGVEPEHICAITFTNKAADEMRERTRSLGAVPGSHISTFHSLCVSLLRRYGPSAGIDPGFSIYDENDRLKAVKQAINDCDLSTENFAPAKVVEAISSLKNRLVDAATYRKNALDFRSRRVAAIYERYQNIMGLASALDFDDLLFETASLLRRCGRIRDQLSRRFRFLLIDEYQDTNYAQYVIARELVSAHNNICATGDPDQSVYRWRGADIGNILAFEKHWPQAVVVKLEENFRSCPAVLSAADRLIACNVDRKPKRLVPVRSEAGEVAIETFEEEAGEAEGIAARISKLAAQGTKLSQIAVFYRVKAASRPLEEALIRRNIPYQVVKGLEFYNRKEIRDVLAYLRVMANPSDRFALLRIINTPSRGIGKASFNRIEAFANRLGIRLFEALRRADEIPGLGKAVRRSAAAFAKLIDLRETARTVAGLVEKVIDESGLADALGKSAGGEEGLENINELVNGAAQYDSRAAEPSLAGYLQEVALFSDTDGYKGSNGRVSLMTLHSAKGLEFEFVFIAALEDGLLPHIKSCDDAAELEEERRLLFVGITRAKNAAYISRCRRRTSRGQSLYTAPSPFLFELGVEIREPEPRARPELEFAPGEAIMHPVFGYGTVTRFMDMGPQSMVEVRFAAGRTKTLMIRQANIKKL